ncbi:MAG TPA: hypothetical protein VM580_26265 [Labilithrix sp.]|nr:hypothetical protein [Labilithrix sp.]
MAGSLPSDDEPSQTDLTLPSSPAADSDTAPAKPPSSDSPGATVSCGITLPQKGDWTDIAVTSGEWADSNGLGGTIVPGTYVLTTAANDSFFEPTTAHAMRETMELAGSGGSGTYKIRRELSSSAGVSAEGNTGTWKALNSAHIQFLQHCPKEPLDVLTYTATSTSLTIRSDFGRVRTYARIR